MDSIFSVLDIFQNLLALILIFGLPIIIVIAIVIGKVQKNKQQKEIYKMIIENHLDEKTAQVLLNDRKTSFNKNVHIDIGLLRSACTFLGIGLGAIIDWAGGLRVGDLFFWLLLAFGIGIGRLIAFIVEIYITNKFSENNTPQKKTSDDER